MKDVVEKCSVRDYLEVLPLSTRAAALKADADGVDLIGFAQQLANEPAYGLATKGGVFWPNDLLAQLSREVHALLCTDDARYEEWRKKIKGEGATVAKVVVVLASSAVASTTGFAASLCVPFVALLLAAASKLGVEAWCQVVTKQLYGDAAEGDEQNSGPS